MIKKKLLYASPFSPMKSGISDYSEILVGGLKEHFDVTLLIDDYKLENASLYRDFEIKTYGKDTVAYANYDHILYNIGNNPYYHSYIYDLALRHPGWVILHDYILYFLTVGYYSHRDNVYSKIYELEGARGVHLLKSCVKKNKDLLACKDIASQLPLNGEIIHSSSGVFVHSEFTKRLLADNYPDARVFKIEMVNMGKTSQRNGYDYLREKFGINDNAIVIGSFGYIERTKLNHLVCETVSEIAKSFGREIYYVMVGEGNYVDNYLGRNIVKTGFVKREIYDEILERCDIVANLRYPSMGETSISLIHAMGLGKPCLVTDYAWFSELPDTAVVKIKVNDMKQDFLVKLHNLVQNRITMDNIANNARDYVARNHAIQPIAQSVYVRLQNIG
jgi:glycosyltransferase involved in cell wall biosynthesis